MVQEEEYNRHIHPAQPSHHFLDRSRYRWHHADFREPHNSQDLGKMS